MSQVSKNNLSNAYLEDTQVQSQNCCQTILRSVSAKNSPVKISSSFSKINSSKDKGIQLIHSFSSKQLNLKKKKHAPKIKVSLAPKQSVLLIKKNLTNETADTRQTVDPGTITVNKKCVDYKNRKILQHSSHADKIINMPQQLALSVRKTQVNMSTQLNTPRDSKQVSFHLFQSVDPSIIINAIQERTQKTVENQQASQVEQKRQESTRLILRKSQKTIEQLYELRVGRKMQILKSEMSESLQEDEYSLVESFILN